MFYQADRQGYRELLPGIELKTLVHGEKTLLSEFRLKAGSLLVAHAHPHEQTGYLVQGRIRLHIGEESRELAAGDGWSIPGGASHSAEILEDAIAIEVFAPVREDYLPGR